jgi:hypothetical protein
LKENSSTEKNMPGVELNLNKARDYVFDLEFPNSLKPDRIVVIHESALQIADRTVDRTVDQRTVQEKVGVIMRE